MSTPCSNAESVFCLPLRPNIPEFFVLNIPYHSIYLHNIHSDVTKYFRRADGLDIIVVRSVKRQTIMSKLYCSSHTFKTNLSKSSLKMYGLTLSIHLETFDSERAMKNLYPRLFFNYANVDSHILFREKVLTRTKQCRTSFFSYSCRYILLDIWWGK